MNRTRRLLCQVPLSVASAALLIALPSPARPQPVDVPIAGPPPTGDGLPPISESARSAASVRMLLLVALGLALVVGLLRLVASRKSHVPEPSPEAELVDRVTRALEAKDEGSDAMPRAP